MLETKSSDGVRLVCHIYGDGPPLLLLAGGPGTDGMYIRDLAEHAARHTVYLPDQRGTGQSGRPSVNRENYNLKQYVADLESVRVAANILSWPVVGHSWGALLALAYIEGFPQNVENLLAIGACGPSIDFLAPALQRLRARMTEKDRSKVNALASLGATDEAASENSRIMTPLFFRDRELGERFNRAQNGNITTWGIFGTVMDDINKTGFDARPALRAYERPVLVLHGDYDHIPSEYPKQTAEAAPLGSYVEIPDCGHFPWLEAPEAFYPVIDG